VFFIDIENTEDQMPPKEYDSLWRLPVGFFRILPFIITP
jgi:hypothetical protein